VRKHPNSDAVPVFVVPMAAESVSELPNGSEWLYELKLDGYRAILIKDGEHVEMRSRNDKDLSRQYPRVIAASHQLKPNRVLLDGEVTALDSDGRPFSQELPGAASDVLRAVQAAGLEGVVAKRRASKYQPGERSTDWVKLKLERQQEFVIGGYRADGARGVDALLVGYYEDNKLRFAGKVRAGMVPHVRRELLQGLKPLRVQKRPFANLPDSDKGRWGGGVTAEDMTAMTWVRPSALAQIRFQEWTTEGRLRHAKYLGLRTDKNAKEVHREP
jgi:ATP-dependent DNA ligase